MWSYEKQSRGDNWFFIIFKDHEAMGSIIIPTHEDEIKWIALIEQMNYPQQKKN